MAKNEIALCRKTLEIKDLDRDMLNIEKHMKGSKYRFPKIEKLGKGLRRRFQNIC
jgi:hypothetical protein